MRIIYYVEGQLSSLNRNSDFYIYSISEPVHFWTHVDRNFFAYFGVGNTQEKFVT